MMRISMAAWTIFFVLFPAQSRAEVRGNASFGFTDDIRGLGIAGEDVFVDFIVQLKFYGFDITCNIAKEQLVGFDLKTNLSIRYTDRAVLDKFIALECPGPRNRGDFLPWVT